MEDYKKKKITKAQLWDKLHEERTMWINKCRNDVQAARAQAIHETLLEIRSITDPVLAALAFAFGKPDEDGEYVLEVKMPEAKEGFEWQARILVSEEGEWEVCAKEVELPKEEEMEEQNGGKTIEFKKFDPDRVYHAKSKEDALQHLKDAMNKQEEEQ